jgi:hypothetical protein
METITIPLKEYKRLRKCLGDAFKIFEGLEVREHQVPKPSPKKRKNGQDKFLRLLENGGRMKKADIV